MFRIVSYLIFQGHMSLVLDSQILEIYKHMQPTSPLNLSLGATFLRGKQMTGMLQTVQSHLMSFSNLIL